jgi:competence protein ComEA
VVGLPPDDDDTPEPPAPAPDPADTPPFTPRRGWAAFDPGRRGLRALAIVAGLAVAVAAFLAWQARPSADPVAVRPAPSAAPLSALSAPTSAGAVVVAVSGRVRRPGLVRLPAGARVADAVDAAGGALPGTDLSFVNLARKLVDGELVVIGVTPPPGTVDTAGGPSGAAGGRVNLNTATMAQLEALPGVGPVLAQRIVDFRTRHGPFRSVADLRQVDGVGDARYTQLKDLVVV